MFVRFQEVSLFQLDFHAQPRMTDSAKRVRETMPRSKTTSRNYRIGRLFTLATVRLEEALGIAVEGQNSRLTLRQQRSVHRRLVRAIERSRAAADQLPAAFLLDEQKYL